MKYEIIIKDIESGEVIRRAEGDCILGAIASMDDENIVASAINHVSAQIGACLGAVAAAQDVVDEFKKSIYEDFKETFGEIVSPELMESLIRAMAKYDIGQKGADVE